MLIDKDNVVFSQTGRLQKEISGALNASIFNDAKVELNKVKTYKIMAHLGLRGKWYSIDTIIGDMVGL